ncbi:MAG: cytochrome c3 family protein [Proteobacteria bacterium]|nr:cytochrome c3 family protein [Pseudomonadota bacterium]
MALHTSTMSLTRLGYGLAGALLFAVLGCEGAHPDIGRAITSSTIALKLPEQLGELQRPPVEFDHGKHTESLKDEGCKACHLKNDDGRLIHKLNRKEDGGLSDALMNIYHDKCIGCHKERGGAGQKTGPVVCAECHIIRPAAVSERQEMAFDYSLHFRHVQATKEKCEKCHHVYNKKQKKLEYVKGQEDACRDCHGEKDDGKNLSLKNASHTSCIDCHLDLETKKEKKRGPVLCNGCHDAGSQAKFEKLPDTKIKRLMRKQKDKIWISAPDAKSKTVPFNHESHEKQAVFCTTCHHKTPKPCKECHTLKGKKEGNGVTMEKAYHLASSEHSCVGCHAQETAKKECAGCHDMMPGSLPKKRSCVICHSGPLAKIGKKTEPTAQVDAGPDAEPMEFPAEVKMAALPAVSDDFPDKLVIKELTDKYKPSKMPHRKIVLSLDKMVRDSKLATHFHGNANVLCAGCHHNGPIGERPRPCKACHGDNAEATKDKPALTAAYHRQCIGCHQVMKIKKALGCTDCHEKAAGEVSK